MTEPVPAQILQILAPLRSQLEPASVREIDDWLDNREWELALNLLADSIFVARMTLDPHDLAALKHVSEEVGVPATRYSFLPGF